MTARPLTKLLIVLSSTRARAVEIAERKGIEPDEVLWPRSVADLEGYPDLPLHVDASLWSHPAAHGLANYFAGRLWAAERRRAYMTRLARGRS